MRVVLLPRLLALIVALSGAAAAQESRPIAQVLREPLPAEELRYRTSRGRIEIEGPTFRYGVDPANGAWCGLEVWRDGVTVLKLEEADFVIDDYRLASARDGKTEVVARGKEKVVLRTEGRLEARKAGRPAIGYVLTSTFFNDGVVVGELKLVPSGDVMIQREIAQRLVVRGRLRHWLHKSRDREFPDKIEPPPVLPKPGASVALVGLSSCLQAFSHEAGLAMFTDVGGTHCSGQGAKSAWIESLASDGEDARVRLAQQIVDIGPGGQAWRLKGGEEFKLRYGLSVVPNRLAHRRWHDLRMFLWVGDARHPYPTDQEIAEVARLGFTLFQMHRLGTPGEPRMPANRLTRVIEKVHESGMLFLWTANADLMYASAPAVADLMATKQWARWQGFNYGGRYTATMDPYCDLVATCLASPNGLADYRVRTLETMMERYRVDGMYIDDNLAYGNCKLWKEHGHPRPVYDCLIELHEMSWRRRQVLKDHCPHAVLVDHSSKALVLPVICDFDVHLFGEGYIFPSVPVFWDLMGSIQNMYAQGSLYAGDSEAVRCASALAYNFDLLTGGGQYTYLDWRLWPAQFPYASGVQKEERLFVRNYNLAQYYFGLYESTPHYFANASGLFSTSAADTYATVYRNRTWGDLLIPLVNTAREPRETVLAIPGLEKLGLTADASYVLFDVNARTGRCVDGKRLAGGVGPIVLPAQGLRLFCLGRTPAGEIGHLWGGKRISLSRDAATGNLRMKLLAPMGVEETIVLHAQGKKIREVRVAGKPADFFRDPASGLVHGRVAFTTESIGVEVVASPDSQSDLPAKGMAGDELAAYLKIGRE